VALAVLLAVLGSPCSCTCRPRGRDARAMRRTRHPLHSSAPRDVRSCEGAHVDLPIGLVSRDRDRVRRDLDCRRSTKGEQNHRGGEKRGIFHRSLLLADRTSADAHNGGFQAKRNRAAPVISARSSDKFRSRSDVLWWMVAHRCVTSTAVWSHIGVSWFTSIRRSTPKSAPGGKAAPNPHALGRLPPLGRHIRGLILNRWRSGPTRRVERPVPLGRPPAF
jgi:hypothetical protein